jgi:hypothetical protein
MRPIACFAASGAALRAAGREDVGDDLLLQLVASNEAPEPRGARLALDLDALGGLVGEDNLLLGHQLEQPVGDGLRQVGHPVEVVAQSRVVHPGRAATQSKVEH